MLARVVVARRSGIVSITPGHAGPNRRAAGRGLATVQSAASAEVAEHARCGAGRVRALQKLTCDWNESSERGSMASGKTAGQLGNLNRGGVKGCRGGSGVASGRVSLLFAVD